MDNTQHSNIEPTQYAGYEHTTPNPYLDQYLQGVNKLPPPPPRAAKNHMKRVLIVAIIIITLLLASIFTYILGFESGSTVHNQSSSTYNPVAIPTPAQTTQPAVALKITAMQLYTIFEHHGLTKNDGVENDSEYRSQGVSNPEGGVVDFTDASTGNPFTISVFATSTEASQAATILYNGGDNAYINNGFCMLHVSEAAHLSNFVGNEYTSIMDTMCKP